MGNKNDSAIPARICAPRRLCVRGSFIGSGKSSRYGVSHYPPPTQQPSNAPKLSPESQAEVEARIQSVFALYGSRFSDAQKGDIRRLATEAQRSLDRLRAFATDNGDGPGLYLNTDGAGEEGLSDSCCCKTATARRIPEEPPECLAKRFSIFSVSELAKRIESKKLSPVTLTQAYLDRSQKLGPRFNAYARLTPEIA